MIEQGGSFPGTFRIRSTGYSGNAKVSIVATFKKASFLDYMYFTQLETSDPVTYGYDSATLANAYVQCSKTWQGGRYDDPIPGSGGDYCNKIAFITGDTINGPLHTNDALAICGTPTSAARPPTRSRSAPPRPVGTPSAAAAPRTSSGPTAPAPRS